MAASCASRLLCRVPSNNSARLVRSFVRSLACSLVCNRGRGTCQPSRLRIDIYTCATPRRRRKEGRVLFCVRCLVVVVAFVVVRNILVSRTRVK
ncbi:hypothetical protein CPB86DRAFT_425427 [Serendipita vermifera]|nr:hypothetical protein CPB86DRAFT_425427 [Serendipita vermifera]